MNHRHALAWFTYISGVCGMETLYLTSHHWTYGRCPDNQGVTMKNGLWLHVKAMRLHVHTMIATMVADQPFFAMRKYII